MIFTPPTAEQRDALVDFYVPFLGKIDNHSAATMDIAQIEKCLRDHLESYAVNGVVGPEVICSLKAGYIV